jgi:hypothetical protein
LEDSALAQETPEQAAHREAAEREEVALMLRRLRENNFKL